MPDWGTRWHGVDQDHQYDTFAFAPDAGEWLRAASDRSALARGTIKHASDIRYGPHGSERLDIFFSGARRPAPVLVFFHGGFWKSRAKEDVSWLADLYVSEGALFVAVEYELAPAANLDRIVDQCRRAFAWIAENIASHGGDAARIHVAGHSAGGHLVAMLLATEWPQFGLQASPICGACVTSGIFDLEPIRHCSLNEVLQLDESATRRNSPLSLELAARPPLVVAWGGAESAEFRRQSETYAAKCRAAGLPCQAMELEGLHHFSVAAAFGDAESPLARAVLQQMECGA